MRERAEKVLLVCPLLRLFFSGRSVALSNLKEKKEDKAVSREQLMKTRNKQQSEDASVNAYVKKSDGKKWGKNPTFLPFCVNLRAIQSTVRARALARVTLGLHGFGRCLCRRRQYNADKTYVTFYKKNRCMGLFGVQIRCVCHGRRSKGSHSSKRDVGWLEAYTCRSCNRYGGALESVTPPTLPALGLSIDNSVSTRVLSAMAVRATRVPVYEHTMECRLLIFQPPPLPPISFLFPPASPTPPLSPPCAVVLRVAA